MAGIRGDGAGEARWEATAMGQRREDNLKKAVEMERNQVSV